MVSGVAFGIHAKCVTTLSSADLQTLIEVCDVNLVTITSVHALMTMDNTVMLFLGEESILASIVFETGVSNNNYSVTELPGCPAVTGHRIKISGKHPAEPW